MATTPFAANFFFWLEAGYFDVTAERKPPLHTWSLAVERLDLPFGCQACAAAVRELISHSAAQRVVLVARLFALHRSLSDAGTDAARRLSGRRAVV